MGSTREVLCSVWQSGGNDPSDMSFYPFNFKPAEVLLRSLMSAGIGHHARSGCRWLLIFIAGLCQPAYGLDVVDDFSASAGSWLTSPGWILVEKADGQTVFRGEGTGDTFARHRTLRLGTSWRIEVDVRFRRYFADGNNRALAAFALFPSLDSGVQLEANLGHRTNSSVQFDTQWFNPSNGTWRNVLQTAWRPNPAAVYRMHLHRAPGADRLVLKAVGTNGSQFIAESSPFPIEVLDRMQVPGLRVNSGQIEFDNFRLVSPYTPPAPPVIQVQPQGQTVLIGSAVRLSVEASGSGPLSYQWFKGVAPIAGATNAIYALGKALLGNAGNFSVQVSNGESFSLSQVASLKVMDAWLRPAAAVRNGGPIGDRFPLEVRAPVGTAFEVQHTLDFSAWTNVTQSVGTGLPVELSVPVGAEVRAGFFRLFVP